VADIPDSIVLKRDRDLEGRAKYIWIRRGILLLIGAFVVAGLLNVFGQRPSTARTSSAVASLAVYAPTQMRGGLIWEARFRIEARREIKDAVLVLGTGWLEGMTVNTIAPSPVGEASDDGKLSLDLGHVRAGQKYLLFIQFQTNPTNVGRRRRSVALLDGDRRLLGIDQTVTVFP
jgi:hypothetical protein